MNNDILTQSLFGQESPKHTIENNLSEAEFELFVSKFSKTYPCKDSNVPNYPRPTYQLPDLSGPGGNTLVLFNLVSKYLKEQGFHLEAKEVQQTLFLKTTPSDIEEYSELAQNNRVSINEFVRFVNLSRYIDFGSCMSWENYDKTKELFKSLGVYQSISPVQFLGENQTQIPEFLDINKNKIDELIISNFDFNTKNCYFKNILYYITDPKTLEYVIKNTTVDIANIDHFSKSPALSTLQNTDSFGLNSIECYLIYLDNFNKDNFVHNIISNNLKDNENLFASALKNLFVSKSADNYNFVGVTYNNNKLFYYPKHLEQLTNFFNKYTSDNSKSFLKSLMNEILEVAPLDVIDDENLKNILANFEPLIMKSMINKSTTKSTKVKF